MFKKRIFNIIALSFLFQNLNCERKSKIQKKSSQTENLSNNIQTPIININKIDSDIKYDSHEFLTQVILQSTQADDFKLHDEKIFKNFENTIITAESNLARLFENLSSDDAFILCDALIKIEGHVRDGKEGFFTIKAWDQYIKLYPSSTKIDCALWNQVKISSLPYEYEGYAEAAIDQLNLIEKYLNQYPHSMCRQEAELECCRVLRILYELFRYGNGSYDNPSLNIKSEGQKYKNKARNLLMALSVTANDLNKKNAQKQLSELDSGQCIYMGPGSINPHHSDKWLPSTSKQL